MLEQLSVLICTGTWLMVITSNKCVITESAFSELMQLPIEILIMYLWYGAHTLIFQAPQNETYSFAKFHFFEYP